MPKKLKQYEAHQANVVPKAKKPEPSGIACTEPKCKGEMLVRQPVQKHPQLKELRRADCGTCGWRGWV